MKSQKVKLLLGLITLTTSSLLTLIVLSNKSLNKITTKQEGVEDTHNSVNLVSQESSESSKVVSVKDFGAIGDGTKDDTSAIQKAIDDVYNAGGGVVNFPSGTYKVTINPNSGQAITIRPKIILQGTSNQDSIIKLADGQGNYNSMLAGERLESDLSDFAMYDLAIDGNGENNPVNAESDLGRLTMRHSLRIYRGSRITIDRCRFINQNNANTITLNGIIFDITINNNIFEFIGGGEADYDHSTIYTHSHTNGKRIEIANNSFSSKNGAGTNGARTAIETHGDEHTVKDNVIREYAFGINVAGYSKSGSSDNLTITGNEIKGVYGGIVIWSYFSPGNTTNPAISNATIANNKISIDIDGWRSLWGDTPSAAIYLEPNSDAQLKNLSIVNNEISVTNFSGDGNASDYRASGIRLWRNEFPNVESENITITGNKITNYLASGIYISMPIRGGEISQNTIINPGQSNGKFSDYFRSGIYVDALFENFQILNNSIVDNQDNNTLKNGIISSAKCIDKCELFENTLEMNSNSQVPLYKMIYNQTNNFKILD